MSAGYTQIRVDYCSVFCVVFNGIYPTGRKAGPYLVGNCIVRADGFAFSALNAFVLINDGFAVLHGNSSPGAYFPAGMSHAAHAFIGHFITIFRTGIACGRNNLHQRRFIIFFIDIALRQSLCDMHRHVFRPQRKSHCKADALPDNRSFSVNIPVLGLIIVYDLIRQRFYIINQIFRSISEIGYFFKNTSAYFTDLCVDTSHSSLLFHRKLIWPYYVPNRHSLTLLIIYHCAIYYFYINGARNQGILL